MTRKTKLLFYLFTAICLCIFYFFACKKIDYSKNIVNFTKEDAQKWFRTVFVKSNENFALDYSSEVVVLQKASNINNDMDFNGKRPDWKNSFAYSFGKYQCVEVPLIYKNKISVIDNEKNLSNDQKHKVAETKLDKLVIIKSPDGEINVRIMTITGTFNYISSQSFDISHNHSNFIDPQFSGTIQIRKWSETVVNTKLIEAGKTKKILKNKEFKNAEENTNSRYTTPPCPQSCPDGEWIEFYAHVCENFENYSEGEAVVVVACGNHSNANTFICMYQQCGVNTGDYGELQNCLLENILPEEDCYCLYWGLSCGDSGGNNDENSPNAPKDPCEIANQLKNDSLNSTYEIEKIRDSAINGKTEVTGLFWRNPNGDLISNSISGTYDSLGVNYSIPAGLKFDGFWHNHFDKDNTDLNMFSTGDMQTLITLQRGGSINNHSDFFFGLTTAEDESYMIVITDFNKFKIYAESFDITNPDLFENKMASTLQNFYLVVTGISASIAENRFANFLKNENTGLSLIKANLNNNTYSKINSSNNFYSGNPTYNNCD